MKKNILTLLFSISLLTNTFANNLSLETKNFKNNPLIFNTAKSDEELISIFSNIEEIHSNGLDYIFSYVQTSLKNNPNFIISAGQLDKLVEDYMIKQLYVKGIDFIPAFKNKTSIFPSNVATDPFFVTIENETKSVISENLKSILSEFQSFVLNDKLNTELEYYDNFVKSKISLLDSEKEKVMLVVAVYTGKSSVIYWNKNTQKWIDLDNISNQSNRLSPHPAKTVLASDMVGGAVGAAVGAYVGFTGGTVACPVIGSVAGVTAGFLVGGAVGAIRASAMTAATQLLSRWFSR